MSAGESIVDERSAELTCRVCRSTDISVMAPFHSMLRERFTRRTMFSRYALIRSMLTVTLIYSDNMPSSLSLCLSAMDHD